MNKTFEIPRLAQTGAFFFLGVLFLWPALDFLTNIWPLQFGNLQWRYGVLGLMASFLHTPVLALLIAMVLSVALHRAVLLRVLSLVCIAASALLLVSIVVFALDVIQLRAVTPEERLASFQAGAILAELKHFTSMVSLGLMGLGGLMTVKKMSTAGSKVEATVEAPLMKSKRAEDQA